MQNEFEKRDSKMMPLVMQIKGLRRNEDAMKSQCWYHKNYSNHSNKLSSLVVKPNSSNGNEL
ncbi:MAG TPA: hypothetical protein VN958_13185 [Chitinophagaceae bacterium]|nr:hypothetical protein [Chitinophagaceae bacterium]